MKTIDIEDLVLLTILTFCENAAELGCPRDKDVDMWFRYMCEEKSVEDLREWANKLIDMIKGA